MASVFISYSKLDEKYAIQIIQALGNKFECWAAVQSLQGGIKWSNAIDEALNQVDVVVVVVTPNSVISQWVTYEWAYALGQKKPVLPLQFDYVDEHKTRIHDKLKEIQIEPFIDPKSSHWIKLEQILQQLVPIGNHSKFFNLSNVIRDNSKDWVERQDAVIALREIQDIVLLNQIAPDLINILKTHQEFLLRCEAATTLSKIKNKVVVDALIHALTTDESSSVRKDAAKSLGILGDKKAAPELIKSLYDKENVRAAAAEALGELREISAVNDLRILLKDQHSRVRVGAARALGAIGIDAEAAVPELIELLEDDSPYHQRARVCDYAADALRLIRNLEGLQALRIWEASTK